MRHNTEQRFTFEQKISKMLGGQMLSLPDESRCPAFSNTTKQNFNNTQY
jgi:hypothetical protein